MQNRPERRPALAPLLACAVLALAAGGDPERVSFRFAPPDGTDCTQMLSVTRTKVFAGLGSQVDRWESVTRLDFERSDDGYTVTATPVSLEMSRDGEPVQDPVRDLLEDIVIRYRIGSDGRIQSVQGFEGLREKLQAAFPPEVAANLAPLLSEEALVAREKAEWDARVGDFAGREFALGDSFESELPFTLPDGESLVYTTRTSIPALEPCAAGSCARVSVRYDSDAAGLSGEAAPAPGAGSRISGSATRLVDPSTLLIQSETGSRKIEMTVEVPGQGAVPATVTEERSYRFEYR
jgi:hypothetical protein